MTEELHSLLKELANDSEHIAHKYFDKIHEIDRRLKLLDYFIEPFSPELVAEMERQFKEVIKDD